jgi:hypothetical protein
LNIDQNMNIVGGGATNTIIEGNSQASIVGGVMVIIGGPVNLSGITIQKGTANAGGGIVVQNTLTLTNSAISGNSASNGGGIYNKGGQLTIINCTVSSNLAIMEGGGIFTSGTLTTTNSTISGNSSGSNGGGIHSGGILTIIINSTISGNSAAANGGGIHNVGTLAIADSSTITQNLADTDLNGIGTGGGIFNLAGSSFTFKNTIFANNGESAFVSSIVPVRGDCAGTLISQGFNIVSTPNSQCTIIGPFSQVDPLLGPLQNNGGPTETHALLNGSPAIDAGEIPNCTDNLGAPIPTDQRGLHRPANGGISLRCDIGAFELYRLVFLPLIMH